MSNSELFLGRRVVAEFLEPRWGTPAPAGRVDDEIGGEDLFSAAARARQHPGTGDPVASRCGDQAGNFTPVPDRDVAQRPDPVADLVFKIRPALRIRWLAGFAVLAQQMAPEEEPELPRSAHHRDTVCHQAGKQPGGTARRGSAPRAATARGRAGPGEPPYGPALTPATSPVRRASPGGTHQPAHGPQVGRPCWHPAPPRGHQPSAFPTSRREPCSPAGRCRATSSLLPGCRPFLDR